MSEMSPQINELATALSKAQCEIEDAVKNSTNPHFRSDYADLASVWEACRGPLSKNGLSVSQLQDGMNLRTVLMHSSGQFILSTIPLLLTKNDMQGLGSALTYARRYALAAIVGVAQVDDDANLATQSPKAQQVTQRVQQQEPQQTPLTGQELSAMAPETAPECCGYRMKRSQFADKQSGVKPWYCPKCNKKVVP